MKTRKYIIILMMTTFLFILLPSISKAADIVNPKQTYTYEMMVRDIRALSERYPNLIKYKIIGNSEYNRPIYAVSLGTGSSTLFINGSHHAREWISTNLNMYMIEQYAKMNENKQVIGGYNVKEVLEKTTIWFVPMVNPDGVTLQQSGLSKFPNNVHASLIMMNEGSSNFKRWKANAKGVDLNRQYNADWKNIKNNFVSPRWSHHKGYTPEQAAETKTLVKFTKEIGPEMAVSYHTSGEILYWNFHQSGERKTRDLGYAKRIGQYTGYSLIYPGLNPSGGGYSDWFIAKYKRPAFTPELGKYAGDTHVPLSEFDRIWSQNKYIGLYTASESYELFVARGGMPKPKEVNINIDGNTFMFEQPALLLGGSTVVPMRSVFEALGSTVEWNQQEKTIKAIKGDTLIELKLGSKTMNINGEQITLSIAPQVINNYTMIPLRAVSEAFGAEVSWDQQTNTVFILSPKDEDPTTPSDDSEGNPTAPPEEDDEPTLPSATVVDKVTDVSLEIKGQGQTGTSVVVKNGDKIIGEGIVDQSGRFSIEIPAQKANTILFIYSINESEKMSDVLEITVSYTSTFTDTVGHWSEESIGYLKDRNITNGLPNGSFGVDNRISRAESAALLVRALKLETSESEMPVIPDVPKSHGFYTEIATIYHHKIMTGNPEGLFKPSENLTRAEMAVIMVNAFNLQSNGNVSFPDVHEGHWAYKAINILASNKIAGGYLDGTFRANEPIKRSEFGALLARVLQNYQVPQTTEQIDNPNDIPSINEVEEGLATDQE